MVATEQPAASELPPDAGAVPWPDLLLLHLSGLGHFTPFRATVQKPWFLIPLCFNGSKW